jgi:hypothetical protein
MLNEIPGSSALTIPVRAVNNRTVIRTNINPCFIVKLRAKKFDVYDTSSAVWDE